MRGALRDALIAYGKDQAPAAVVTTELALAMQVRLQLEFVSPAERVESQTSSLTRHLMSLVREGFVERLDDASTPTSEVGRRRWKCNSC